MVQLSGFIYDLSKFAMDYVKTILMALRNNMNKLKKDDKILSKYEKLNNTG